MVALRFISRKLRFQGNVAAVAIAVSFFVMIVAVAVSAGFRQTLRAGVAAMTTIPNPQSPIPNPQSPVALFNI